jgi:hypothetical protein
MNFLKILVIFTTGALGLNPVIAEKWSDVSFGIIPLSQDFVVTGQLRRGLLNRQTVEIQIYMSKEQLADKAPYELRKHWHRAEIFINGVRCEAATLLTTQRDLSANIKYGMRVDPLRSSIYSEESICPYYMSFNFGEMEEDVEDKVFTELEILSKHDSRLLVFRGELLKK